MPPHIHIQPRSRIAPTAYRPAVAGGPFFDGSVPLEFVQHPLELQARFAGEPRDLQGQQRPRYSGRHGMGPQPQYCPDVTDMLEEDGYDCCSIGCAESSDDDGSFIRLRPQDFRASRSHHHHHHLHHPRRHPHQRHGVDPGHFFARRGGRRRHDGRDGCRHEGRTHHSRRYSIEPVSDSEFSLT